MRELKNWNLYDAYKYTSKEIGELLWIPHLLHVHKDTIGMLVKVDDSTANFVGGDYNWLTLHYLVPITKNKAQWNEPGIIKLELHGIDDTNMSAWIDKAPLSEIYIMWNKIEQFIFDPELGQLEDGVNGHLLLEYSEYIFPVTSFDYN